MRDRYDLNLSLSRYLFRRVKKISKGKKPEYFHKMIRYYSRTNQDGLCIINRLKDLSIQVKGKSFLDLGCGLGGLCQQVQKMGATNIYGVEIEPFKLDFAKKNCMNIPQVNISYLDVDYTDRFFNTLDLIVADQVMEHVKNPNNFASFISNSLNHNGLAFIGLPNGFSIENVLSEPHLAIPLISLMPSKSAAIFAEKIAGHKHYAEMMGPRYLKHTEILNIFRSVGLEASFCSSIPSVEELHKKRDSFISEIGLIKKSLLESNDFDVMIKHEICKELDTYRNKLYSADFHSNEVKIHFGVSNLEYSLKKL